MGTGGKNDDLQVLEVHVLSPCGASLQSVSRYLERLRADEPAQTPWSELSTALTDAAADPSADTAPWPDTVRPVVNLLLAGYDLDGRPLPGSGAPADTVAFAEADPAFGLSTELRCQRVVLHLLVDPHDIAQRPSRAVLQAWLAARNELDPNGLRIELEEHDVSIVDAEGRAVSALNRDASFENRLDILQAAEHRMVEVASDLLAQSTRTEPWFVNTRPGTALAKHALAQAMPLALAKQAAVAGAAAALAGGAPSEVRSHLPPASILDVTGSSLRLFEIPALVSPSALHHRFDLAVRAAHDAVSPSHEIAAMIRTSALQGFLVPRGDHREVSGSAWSAVESLPYLEGPVVSACAELLARQGSLTDRMLGERLRRHVERWHLTGLFRKNLVPEIVLHDEAHAQVVDRHVAAILEPALSSGRVDARFVYLTALAAWLHDWGHASGGTVDASPTFSSHVRALHGPLSARRIRDDEGLLSAQLGLDPEEREIVALLAAHHQSWTSCDHQRHDADRSEQALAFEHGLPVESFDTDVENASHRLVTQGLRPLDRDLVQSMLAVVRLADGADLGLHRTPHLLTPATILADAWGAAYSQTMASMRLLDRQAGAGSRKWAATLQSLFPPSTIAAILRNGKPWVDLTASEDGEANLKDAVLQMLVERMPALDSAPREIASELQALRELLVHLIMQHRWYYPQHAAVGSVHFLPAASDGEVTTLRVLVRRRPAWMRGEQLDHLDDDSVLRTVRKDVLKEVGLEGKDQDRRTALRQALARIGLRIDDSAAGFAFLDRPVQPLPRVDQGKGELAGGFAAGAAVTA